jgi:mono/diheme cytochrome c family protein
LNVTPALPNVMGDFNKTYAHPTTTLSGLHDAGENAFPLNANRHAECADCHNSHAASATGGASSPPGLQAALLGSSGYDGAAAVRPATNEYQVCFKCHADSSNKPQSPGFATYGRTPNRLGEQSVVDRHNLRQKFGSSFARHNVTQARRLSSAQVPSLRSFMLNADGSQGRSMALGTYIYCTDCHASNSGGAKGPHGSIYPHILTMRYEQEIPPLTPGSSGGTGYVYTPGPFNVNGPFALCDRCHNLQTLTSDPSGAPYTKHNRHTIGEPASCSTCHDPHGIHDGGGNTTTNPHMVSFDLALVGPTSGGALRIDSGARECYLRCHGNAHNPRRY